MAPSIASRPPRRRRSESRSSRSRFSTVAISIGAHGFRRDDRTLFGSFCLEVAIANRPVIVQDARSRHSPAARTAWGADLVAYAGVPLSPLDGARHGAIGACLPTRRAWQDRDLAILRAFGEAVSVILELELRLARATNAYASLEAGLSDFAMDTPERESLERRRITVDFEPGPFHDEEGSGGARTKNG
jgi:GAF domain-containing protein